MSVLKATYGSVRLDGKFWIVNCEPHVRIRLKRVFGKIGSRAYGEIKIADSPETCREILWFSERFPLEIHQLDYMTKQADRHKSEEQVVFDLVHGHTPPAEFDLQIPLRPYQRIATDLALKTGGLLASVGADPFMSKILGIKRSQIEGIKDPAGAALPIYDVGGDNIRRLAMEYLDQRRATKQEHAPVERQLDIFA